MGTIIGPLEIPLRDRKQLWFDLRQLRESVKWMRAEDPVGFESAINKENIYYKERFKEFVSHVH